MHIILPDGEVLRAGYGTLVVLRAVGWWWLAPFMWPPLLWLVELGYQLVARNRVLFSKVLFRDE